MKRAVKNKSRESTVIQRKNSLNIATIPTLLVIIVFLGVWTYLYMESSSPVVFRPEVTEYFQQKNAKREFKKLNKYADSSEMIASEGIKSHSSREKQNKISTSANPPKEAKPVDGKSEDNEQLASLVRVELVW